MSQKSNMITSRWPGPNGKRILRIALVFLIVIAVASLCYYFIVISRPRIFSCPDGQPLGPSPLTAEKAGEGSYVQGQVIVIGSDTAITEVIEGLTDTIRLEPVKDCDLSFLSQIPSKLASAPAPFPFSPYELSTLRLRLMQVSSTSAVTDVAEIVRQINASISSRHVFADPNYLTTRLAAARPCGDPNESGGSPNESGGSPLTGIGPPAAVALFEKQWAMRHIGLDPGLLKDPVRLAALSYTGKGIRVGVFDTSPFTETVAESKHFSVFTPTVDWMYPPLSLTVIPSTTRPDIQPLSVITDTHMYSDVSEHGLFVAGLIHEIAPESEIRLYEVLDHNGCGNLFGLINRLGHFISQANAERGRLRGAVINLSLGITPGAITDTIYFKDGVPPPPEEVKIALANARSAPIWSLLLMMHAAYQSDIVVVAAAGNSSWRNELQGKPLPPQLPAAHPFVIGVAGSNANRQRSCFSNWGDVSAPAGEGSPLAVTVTPGPDAQRQGAIASTDSVTTYLCSSQVQTCKGGDCDYAVIGPVLTYTTEYSTHYAYWSGTSFATPLVSGLAALVLDIGGTATQSWAGPSPRARLTPDEVVRAIKCGAALADGVINVPFTLARCIRSPAP